MLRTCLELSIFRKLGISGACTAIGYGLGATNPVTLAALAALPWLPNALNRCLRRNHPQLQNQQIRPVIAPQNLNAELLGRVQPIHSNQEQKQGAARKPNEEPDMVSQNVAIQRVLYESLARSPIEEKKEQSSNHRQHRMKEQDNDRDLQKAIERSLSFDQNALVCPYAQGLNATDKVDSDAIIPPSLVFGLENLTHCNIANFIVCLLMKENLKNETLRDMYGQKIFEKDLINACDQLGIDFVTFKDIWNMVQQPESRGGIHHIDVERQLELRKNERIKIFKIILESSLKTEAKDAAKYLSSFHSEIWNKK
jgi:hypothetical protein